MSEINARIEIAGDLPALQGDSQLSEGALLNLVSNAIKYSASGREVTLCAEAKEDGGVLKVWNPCPVIRHGELARLFEPFYRRNEQEERARGWGLGLAFVKRIAEQHRGGVDAFSETSQGVRFISNLSVAPLVLSEVHP